MLFLREKFTKFATYLKYNKKLLIRSRIIVVYLKFIADSLSIYNKKKLIKIRSKIALYMDENVIRISACVNL